MLLAIVMLPPFFCLCGVWLVYAVSVYSSLLIGAV